ncbi:MAG: Sulfur carrier protein adenylyltransferase ThiF [Labilithrix sp.]|nr:Sulfur carrier protein adenylyltransferase ThiF [Labilithrix sp.]
MTTLARARVLLVGIGGLGCPAALALASAGVGTLAIADDDDVEASNLHRQILFRDQDVGRSKVVAAAGALARIAPQLVVEQLGTRLLPHNAVELAGRYDLIVEGSDNFATKFLAADAARLAGKPIVHAAAVRWHGTALAVAPSGRPCYRCLFEDIPRENAPSCADAGVIGPMVGVVAAAQADLALAILRGDASVFGTLVTFDAKALVARRRPLAARRGCALCGDDAGPAIRSIEAARYAAADAS